MFVGFKSRNHPQQVAKHGAREDTDDRRTSPELFGALHLKHGFTLDVSASALNAQCPKYFTRETDGLAQPWGGGNRVV